MKRFMPVLCYILVLILSKELKAEVITLASNQLQDITHQCEVFVDKTAELDLDSIAKLPAEAFMPLRDLQLEGKYDRSKYAYWVRFQVRSSDDKLNDNWVIYAGQHQKIDAFQILADTITHQQAGFGRILTEADRLWPNKYSTLLLPESGTSAYYLRIANELEFSRPRVSIQSEKQELMTAFSQLIPYYIFYATIFSFLLFVAIFTLSQFAIYKEQALLFYALLAVVNFILYFWLFDLKNPIFQLLPPTVSAYPYHTTFTLLPPIPGMLFLMSYFRTKENYPQVHTFFLYSIAFIIVAFFLDKLNYLYDKDLAWRISDFFRIAFFVVVLYPLAVLLKSRAPLVRYIVWGIVINVICVLINMCLRIGQWVDTGQLWDVPLVVQFVGISISLIFFWLGLGYRSRQIQEDRARIAEELRQEQRERDYQRRISELRATFFTNITHEFRTPLTIINGLSNQVERKSSGELFTIGQRIRRNGEKMLQLVNQLLGLSRIESGQMTVSWQQSDMMAYLEALVNNFETWASRKGINMVFTATPTALSMDFDTEKTRIILSNLLSNAVKFTHKGDVITVKAARSETDSSVLVLEVSDTGDGIAAEQLPHIFDRFYQADGPHKRIGLGTGIGLALVRELCNLLGISISVKSVVGEETIFTLLFPIRQQAPLQVLDDALPVPDFQQEHFIPTSTVEDVSTTEKPSVLIIEDNTDLLYLLRKTFENDYHVLSATDGEEGIEKALQRIPDLIVSDVMMPGKDGFQVCQYLKQHEKTDHIPIVLLTAKATQVDKNQGLYAGADAYIMKPFDDAELRIRAAQLIQLRQRLLQNFLEGRHLAPATLPKSAFLQEVDKVLSEHYGDPDFSGLQLCEALFIGKSTLYARLKKESGLSTGLYIRAYRIRRAQQLLLSSPQLQIQEVAYAVGFTSQAYFSQVFKELNGCSAGDFRAKNGILDNS